MLNIVSLPVVMALSWMPASMPQTPAPSASRHETAQPAQQVATVTCPITGEQIPSCCCPVKK